MRKVTIQQVTRAIGKWKVESFPLDEAFTGPHAEADGAQGVDAEKFCVVVVICTILLKAEIADFFKRFSVWETFFRIFFFLTEYASKDENMFLKRVWRKFHRQELTLNTENATIFYF